MFFNSTTKNQSMEYKIKIGGKEMVFDPSNLAEQASGACFLKYGGRWF